MPAPTVATKYGDMPSDYKEAITRYFQDHLKNPESIRYREITKPEQGYVTSIAGSFLMQRAACIRLEGQSDDQRHEFPR